MSKYRNKFDVIIVGAGPAGTTAGYVLAKAGIDVLIIERGAFPGAKNMFGGVLYGKVLNDLMPNFWEEAPVERYITQRVITFMSGESHFSVDFKSQRLGQSPPNAFSLMRSKFDKWFAEKAQKAGAVIIPETLAVDLLWEGTKVAGVKVKRDSGELYAKVVIIADGANSTLSKKCGLRTDFEPGHFSVGIKEILALPPRTIEERFHLQGSEGVDQLFIGSCTEGLKGGGFLYTNHASISIGLVVDSSSIKKADVQLWKMLEGFKQLSPVRELIKDSVPKEYSAHLVPSAGIHAMPKLYGEGVLIAGDAASLVFNTGLSLEGVNFAMASGIAAAETIKNAIVKNDFSKAALAAYETKLNNSFVMKDLKSHKKASDILLSPRLYRTYPETINDFFENVYTVDIKPRKMLWRLGIDILRRKKVSPLRVAVDLVKAGFRL